MIWGNLGAKKGSLPTLAKKGSIPFPGVPSSRGPWGVRFRSRPFSWTAPRASPCAKRHWGAGRY